MNPKKVKQETETSAPPSVTPVTLEEQIKFDQLLTEADKVDLKSAAPREVLKKEWHGIADIQKMVTRLAKSMGISETMSIIAMILLFNKGAANEGTPNTISVSVEDCTSDMGKSSIEI